MTHEILEANTIALWSKFTTFPEVNDFSVLNRADKLKRSCKKFTQDLKKKKQIMLMNAEEGGQMIEILKGPKKDYVKQLQLSMKSANEF